MLPAVSGNINKTKMVTGPVIIISSNKRTEGDLEHMNIIFIQTMYLLIHDFFLLFSVVIMVLRMKMNLFVYINLQ